jgi:hypothetical protein
VLAAFCAAIGALLTLPLSASAHSSLMQAGPAAVPIGYASAVIGGEPWPGHGVARIRYFNASSAKWPVAQAVKAWNSSGARVRLVPVARRRAQVVISDSPGPRSDLAMSGFASVGYIYPGGGFVKLSRLAHPRRPNYSMAGVASHELGHVLGLDHEDGSCATMNTSLWAECADARPCRLLERDDLRGAIKLYGGRARMARPAFCPKAPSEIRATASPNAYSVTLEWRNPRGSFFDRVEVARGKGECPRRPGQGAGWDPSSTAPGAGARLVDRDFVSGTRLLTGRYCYALWGAGDQGLRSRRKTVWVEFDPSRPAAPTNLQAVLGAGGNVSLSWATAPHPELDGVVGNAAEDRCPANPDDGFYAFSGADGQGTAQFEMAAGRYCFAAWSVDSVGALSGPAVVWLEYAGRPPSAEFTFDAFSLTAYFTNYSFDEDGEIVESQWDFGDGSVSQESDPEHTYATPGTYTVRLTVTDDGGLSARTTQQVTVSN